MMKTDQSCGKCDYWQEVTPGATGRCRRYPPQMVVFEEVTMTPVLDAGVIVGQKPSVKVNVRGEFPMMSVDNIGCGEFVQG